MTSSNPTAPPGAAAPSRAEPGGAPRRLSLVDRELVSMTARGILRFHEAGGAEAGALALAQARHVLLVTGFNVAPGMPETDGPVGAAALARALRKLGKRVALATDTPGRRIAAAVLEAVDCRRDVPLRTFDAPHDGADPATAAGALLDGLAPDAVFALEVPARTIDGTRRNMRGERIDGFNAHLDAIVLEADRRGVPTFGVGDGGNEVGMAAFFERIPRALNGAVMASLVPARYPITAWNSNLGAESVAALMLAAAGRLDELHSPAAQSRMIMAAMRAGAVDGVTRCGSPDREVEVGGRIHVSGVDGFSLAHHRGQLVDLERAVAAQVRRPPPAAS